MVFKRFYMVVLIRVILLMITCLILAWSAVNYHDLLISLNIIAFIILQAILLIRYVNRTNRELAQFFLSISNEDTSVSYLKKSHDKSFTKLYEQLDRLNEHVRKIKTDLANQELFNKIIISHISTGIMVINPDGRVKLHNLALSKLLAIPVISNVNQLNNIEPGLPELFLTINPGEGITKKVRIGGTLKELLIRTSGYRENENDYKLISVQDIKPELDDKEMESWQKLIRILTHEITNSIGPINSTIDTIADFFISENEGGIRQLSRLNQKTIDDTVKGIRIIRERSTGLLDFVQQFRDLTLIPGPKPVCISVRSLFDHVSGLMREDLVTKGIVLSSRIDPDDLEINADKPMVEQVLIKRVKNLLNLMLLLIC